MRRNLIWVIGMMTAASLVFTSCGDDDEPAPVAPVVSIDNASASGDIGDVVSATISGELDGAFAKMEISKFIGTAPDASYGTGGVLEVTSGLPYNFSYTIGTEGLENPIRFNFLVTDANDLTDEVDLVITTNASNEQLLVSFNWRYSSLIWENAESILECEEDNIYSFEADGSMSVDFGALTGSGGGSCDFDGTTIFDGWAMNEAQDTLQWFRADAFTGAATDTVTYSIKEFTKERWVADETNLFGVFEYTYTAVAKP